MLFIYKNSETKVRARIIIFENFGPSITRNFIKKYYVTY